MFVSPIPRAVEDGSREKKRTSMKMKIIQNRNCSIDMEEEEGRARGIGIDTTLMGDFSEEELEDLNDKQEIRKRRTEEGRRDRGGEE
jgi:hypothetical protein